MSTIYVKTISLDCDEVAVVLMALAERRIEAERLAERYAGTESAAYWNASVAETNSISARLAALTYVEAPSEAPITDAELAALLEEEALEDARLAAEEAEWEEQDNIRRDAEYDHDSHFEYEYEDRLNPFVD